MSTEVTEASRGTAAGFITITLFGIAAAVLLTFGSHLVQPLGAVAEQPPAVTTPATEEPSEPAVEETKPQPSVEPVPVEPTAEPAPAEPVDLGEPVTPLGLALVAEFGPETTFWRSGEQVRDPEKGDTFRSSYLPSAYVSELATRWVGTDGYWLLVEKNSETEGLEVLIKR